MQGDNEMVVRERARGSTSGRIRGAALENRRRSVTVAKTDSLMCSSIECRDICAVIRTRLARPVLLLVRRSENLSKSLERGQGDFLRDLVHPNWAMMTAYSETVEAGEWSLLFPLYSNPEIS